MLLVDGLQRNSPPCQIHEQEKMADEGEWIRIPVELVQLVGFVNRAIEDHEIELGRPVRA